MLFDFDIKYRMGKLNQVADALSCHPRSNIDVSSDKGSKEEYETISYEIVSEDLSDVINGIEIPMELKSEIQRSIHEEPERDNDNIQGIGIMVDVLSKMSP